MPGKGATRSKSAPRARPQSSGARPQTTESECSVHSARSNHSQCSVHSHEGGLRGLGAGSKVGKLNLGGTSGSFSKSALSTSGPEKCICSICTCGKHNCPVQSKTDIFYGGDGQNPFTTTHGDYKSHGTHHYHAGLMRSTPQNEYSPGDNRFDHTTTAQDTYTWHRPSSSLRAGSRMEKGVRSPSPMLHSSILTSPDAPMDLTTSYGANFVEHPIPSKSAKPSQATYSYGSPRDLRSTHQNDFAGKQNARCPASILPNRQASARSGHVKYTLDFTGTWN